MRKELQGLKMATIEVAKMLKVGADKSIVIKFIKNIAAAGNTASDVFDVKADVLMELGPDSLEFKILDIAENKMRTAEKVRVEAKISKGNRSLSFQEQFHFEANIRFMEGR